MPPASRNETSPSPRPDWLQELSESVIACFQPIDVLSPIGCHHYFDELTLEWEVALFLGATEVVGGFHDGQLLPTNFALDLVGLLNCFDVVSECQWQALPFDEQDELASHVSVAGVVDGHRVSVRVLAEPPNTVDPSRRILVQTQEIIDLW